MTSPLNTWCKPARLSVRSLGQLAASKACRPVDLMEGLIAGEALTVFRADPGVGTEEFMYLLAQSLAVKRDVGPFTVPKEVKGNLFVGSGAATKHVALAGLLEARCNAEVPDHEGEANLAIYHRHLEDDAPIYLDTTDGQRALLNSLLIDCKFVMIDDVEAFLSPKGTACDDEAPLSALCKELASRHIALVLFEKSRHAAEPFRAAYRQGAQHLVRLVKDDCAPVEVGGGLGIVRERMRYSEKAPAKIQWWWTFIEGDFDEGCEWRHPESKLSAKDIAIAERRAEVKRYKDAGWLQKDIAAKLEINQATVSRDLAEVTKDAADALDLALEEMPPPPKPVVPLLGDPENATW